MGSKNRAWVRKRLGPKAAGSEADGSESGWVRKRPGPNQACVLGGFHFRGHKASRSQGSGGLGHQGFRVYGHSGVQETTHYCMMVLGHCRVITVHNGFPRVVRAIRIIMVIKVIRIVRVIRVSRLLGY